MASITINSTAINGWQGTTTGVQLRIYTNGSFTANGGALHPVTVTSNPASLGTFYQTVTCTISGNTLTVPSIVLDSTTDSPDNPSASYSAVLWDTASNQQIQPFFTSFALQPTPTTTTWGNIFAAGSDY